MSFFQKIGEVLPRVPVTGKEERDLPFALRRRTVVSS
jgi:hypothetical protein